MDADELIKRFEGWRPTLYDDATGRALRPGDTIRGHPTIGYGFALDVRQMPEWLADIWRRDIVAEVASGLTRRAPWVSDLDPVRRAALINMAYALGVSGLLRFRKMLAALQARDWERAHTECLDSEVARQQPGRYQELARMLLTGLWAQET